MDSGCFEPMFSKLRASIRVAQGRQSQPSTVVVNGRTLQFSGPHDGYDGYKRRRGRKARIAILTRQ